MMTGSMVLAVERERNGEREEIKIADAG